MLDKNPLTPTNICLLKGKSEVSFFFSPPALKLKDQSKTDEKETV